LVINVLQIHHFFVKWYEAFYCFQVVFELKFMFDMIMFKTE